MVKLTCSKSDIIEYSITIIALTLLSSIFAFLFGLLVYRPEKEYINKSLQLNCTTMNQYIIYDYNRGNYIGCIEINCYDNDEVLIYNDVVKLGDKYKNKNKTELFNELNKDYSINSTFQIYYYFNNKTNKLDIRFDLIKQDILNTYLIICILLMPSIFLVLFIKSVQQCYSEKKLIFDHPDNS